MREISGYTIFCEDIRREENNQSSYIGVYNGNFILIDEEIDVLPRLAVVVHLSLSAELKGKTPTIRLYLADEHNEKKLLAEERLPKVPESRNGGKRLNAILNISLEGLKVTAGSKFSVLACVDDGEDTGLGSIRVILDRNLELMRDDKIDPKDNPSS
ncbi:MAG: hypothetical protein ACRECW_07200 [Phyllobacterium sp.]